MVKNLPRNIFVAKENVMKIRRIPKNIREDIIQYKKILAKNGVGKPKIILFGSIAKGKSNKYSDIDIAVVSPKFGKNFNKEIVKLMILTDKINNDIEPIPFNPKDLNNKYYALANEVRKYGIEVK